MALRVGLTGGIGSGKSIVAKVFETLGMPVYYADDAAKRLMNENEDLKALIKKHFGTAAYKDGILDRKYLAEKVFSNKEKLELLNSIVHPATIKDAEEWMRRQTTPYAIKEAALIFESGAQQYLDYVIGVYAPAILRIHRSMKRNNITKEEVTGRMNKQINEEIKMKLCDFVITNDEQQAVLPQIMELHEKLQKLAIEKNGIVSMGE
jgi:dephospho-CoA kinase